MLSTHGVPTPKTESDHAIARKPTVRKSRTPDPHGSLARLLPSQTAARVIGSTTCRSLLVRSMQDLLTPKLAALINAKPMQEAGMPSTHGDLIPRMERDHATARRPKAKISQIQDLPGLLALFETIQKPRYH